MSNKTEFKDVLITEVNYQENGIIVFKIEDKRTFNQRTTIHEFDMACRLNALYTDINRGDKVIIEASLSSKEYEYHGETKKRISLWATKVYKIDTGMAKPAQSIPSQPDEIQDVPF